MIETKFIPPRTLADLLSRQRVVSVLSEKLKLKLSLLVAPAGFGKTTILTDLYNRLHRERDINVVWISLDRDDAEAVNLLATIALGLDKAGCDVKGLPSFADLHLNAQEKKQIQTNLLQALIRAEQKLVVIFDDYHLAASKETDEIFSYLLAYLPGHVNFTLATRIIPTFDFSKLQLEGLSSVQDQEALRFTGEEVAALFSNLRVTSQTLEIINDKTEGWPAALQMARSWLANSADPERDVQRLSGSLDAISLFFTEQVFEKQPEYIKEFLLKMSVANSFNSDLANAITGRQDSWNLIRELATANAFIVAVGDTSAWFRMHPLYREFLASRLLAVGQERINDLQLKAAAWYQDSGNLKEAVYHYCAAEHFEKAAAVVATAGGVFRGIREGLISIKALMDCFPSEVIDQYPNLMVVNAYILQKQGRNEEARDTVRKLQRSVRTEEGGQSNHLDPLLEAEIKIMEVYVKAVLDEEIKAEEIAAVEAFCAEIGQEDYVMKGMVNNLRCVLYFRKDDYALAAAVARESLKYYKMAGAYNASVFVSVHLGEILIANGKLNEAFDTLLQTQGFIAEKFEDEPYAAALVNVLLAYLYSARAEDEAAYNLLATSMEQIENGEGWYEVQVYAFQTVIELAASLQDSPAVAEWQRRGLEFSRIRGLRGLESVLAVQGRELLLRNPEANEPEAKVSEIKDLLGADWMVRDASVRVTVEQLCRDGRHAEALQCLDTMIQEAEGCGRMISLVPYLILQSVVLDEVKEEKAISPLHHALLLAFEEGYLRPFLQYGERLSKLLDRVVRTTGASNMPQRLLDFIVRIQTTLAGSWNEGGAEAFFSDRELQILQGLSRGESNKVIGRQLNLSPNTVKYHLRSLYDKLGAHNRAVAVEVARQKGLL